MKDLLQEMATLRESGFDEGQIEGMMGERHKKALETVEAFQEDIK